MNDYYVYIMTNASGTLYIGVTNNIVRRVYEHKRKLYKGFTQRYNITELVYYEYFNYVNDAIDREKQLKRWRREKKIWLVNTINPEWNDLAKDLFT